MDIGREVTRYGQVLAVFLATFLTFLNSKKLYPDYFPCNWDPKYWTTPQKKIHIGVQVISSYKRPVSGTFG